MKQITKYQPSIIYRALSMLLIVAMLNLTLSCHYFKVRTLDDLTADLSKEQLRKYQNMNKYFVLHSGDKRWHVTVLKVDAEKKIMECKWETLDEAHKQYAPGVIDNKRYKTSRDEDVILNEVHIVTSHVDISENNMATVPLAAISRIDIIEADNGRTIASYVFATLGIFAGAAVILTIIIILTKSSCPFVYAYDGQSYIFKGEIYGGAIFKPLERDDYMHLQNIDPGATEFKMKITNELLERQYTNLAKAILVEHNKNEKIFIDDDGKIHSVANPQTSQSAILNDSNDLSASLTAIDSNVCMFNSESKKHSVNDLVLNFQKPENAKQAKLILHAKNSLWLDFAFTEFTKLFGSYYSTYVEKQRTANRDSLFNWTVKQGLPLSVYVKKNNEWKLLKHIPTVGPLAARDFCLPVDVSDITSPNLEIKVSCGFMFWELDYAAIDFSDDVVTNISELQLLKATDENRTDVSALIAATDGLYLVQPHAGCEVQLTYSLPPLKNDKDYDVFFHSRGYYEHVRNYTGLPDKEYLMSMKQEGAFIDFTKVLYDKIIENSELTSLNQ